MTARPGTFRSAWSNHRWRRFLVSGAVSSTGDFLYAVALVVYLIEETGSATWVAAAAIARMLAYTLLGPVGGVIADRFDRRKLMVLLDLSRAAVMTAIAIVIVADGPPSLVVALVVTSAALTTPYRPAGVAATPLIVGEDDLAAANAAEASLGQLAWFVGPAGGAVVVAISGPAAAFLVNAATFAVSALLVAGIGHIGSGTAQGGGGGGGGGGEVVGDDEGRGAPDRSSVVRQMGDGVRAIREVPGLSAMTALLIAVLFAFGIEQVVMVLVVSDRLGLDAGGVGVLSACTGVGGLLAAPFASKLAARRDAGRMLAFTGVLMGAPLALLAVTDRVVVAGGLMLVEGVGNIALEVLLITLLQRGCPDALLGRVYSLQDTGGALAQLAGAVAAPLLVAVSLELALWVGGGSLVVLSLLTLPALQAMSARTEAERARLAPLVAELAATGVLGDASPAALERIARQVTVERFDVGSTVFAEDDPSTDLYVIRRGEVEVVTECHGEVRRLVVGDWFGEIGLLRELSRTATIRASAPTELLVVPGAVFVAAVTGDAGLPSSVASALESRLARTHPHLVEPSTA